VFAKEKRLFTIADKHKYFLDKGLEAEHLDGVKSNLIKNYLERCAKVIRMLKVEEIHDLNE
jgi:hypothetical protein